MSSRSRRSSKLFGVNISSQYSKVSELARYLKDLLQELSGLEQDSQTVPQGLDSTAKHLLHPKVIECSNKEVRVLAGCCIVELLRIFAPEAPYNDSDMIRVFSFISSLIGGLQTTDSASDIGQSIVYIMTSLATVKSCVLPVILAQNGVDGGDEIVQSMFNAIITSIRPEDSQEVLSFAAGILITCLEEFESVPMYVLNILLLPLLPAAKQENPTAYKLAACVIRSVTSIMKPLVAKMVEDILVGSSQNSHEIESDIAEEIYLIIFELHKISPALLNGVFPSLTLQLKVEEEDVRQKAVKLLGKLYLSDSGNYTKEFPRDFKEFLGRMNDVCVEIRTAMVDVCSALLETNEIQYLEDLLVKKLRDPAEDVRLRCVEKLVNFAESNLTKLNIETFEELGERAKDKKFEVRKAALVGLSKLYFRYISSQLLPLSDIVFESADSFVANIDEAVVCRLKFVPSILLKCWGYPEFSSKYLIIQMFQEQIIPIATANRDSRVDISYVRATALILLVSTIDENDWSFIRAILAFKSKVRDEISKISVLKSKQLDRNGSAQSPDEITEQLKQLLYNITHLVYLPEKKFAIFEKLINSRDKVVLKLLNCCISFTDDIIEGDKHKVELQKRFDSKSDLGEYLGIIYDCAASFWCDYSMLSCLLDSTLTHITRKKFPVPFADLISALSKYLPELFSKHAQILLKWLSFSSAASDKNIPKASKERCFEYSSEIISNCGSNLVEDKQKQFLVQEIISLHKNSENIEVCEKLGKMLMHITFLSENKGESNPTYNIVDDYVRLLCSHTSLSLVHPRILYNLSFLSTLFQVPSSAYEQIGSIENVLQLEWNIVNSVRDNLLQLLNDLLFLNEEIYFNNWCLMATKGLKLFAQMLCIEEEFKQFRFQRGDGLEFISLRNPSTDFVEFVENLFKCICIKGANLGKLQITIASEKSSIFSAAAESIVLFIKLNVFAELISVDQWRQLAGLFLSDDQALTQRLVSSYSMILRVHPVHIKFLSYAIVINNDISFSDQILKVLAFAIKRLRRTHEELVRKAAAALDSSRREHLNQFAAKTMPELILSYVIYLFSSEPWLPSTINIGNAEDSRKLKDISLSIQNIISCLQETLHVGTSNLPFLFKMSNLIYREYVDRLDSSNSRLYIVTNLTLRLLNERVKSSENVQVYPGQIYLPRELYVRKQAGIDQRSNTTNDVDNVDSIVEKVFNVVHKGKTRIAQSMSPSPSKSKIGSTNFDSGKKRMDLMEGDRTTHVAKKNKVIEEEVPTRQLPKRTVKNVVKSYEDPEENDSETEKWNNLAAKETSQVESKVWNQTALKKRQSAQDDFENSIVEMDSPTETTRKKRNKRISD